MEGLPMITRSKSRARKAHKVKNTNLNPVTHVMKLCSVSFETVGPLIVGWSAGLAGPDPSAPLRQRHQSGAGERASALCLCGSRQRSTRTYLLVHVATAERLLAHLCD